MAASPSTGCEPAGAEGSALPTSPLTSGIPSTNKRRPSSARFALNGRSLLFVAQNMLADGWCGTTFHTMCATHRSTYQALVVATSALGSDDVPRGAARFPESVSARQVRVCVRTGKDGVALEHCSQTGLEPVSACLVHLRWVSCVFHHSAVVVRLVNNDSSSTTTLLRAWLAEQPRLDSSPSTQTAVPLDAAPSYVQEFCGRDLSSLLCTPPFVTRGEETPAARSVRVLLERATAVELLGDRPGDAMLRGFDTLTCLIHFTAAKQHMLQTLKPLARLTSLVTVDARETSISDPDVAVLAELPRLEKLCIDACVMLTNLNPLAKSRSLRVLSAGQCRQLLHVSRLGSCGKPLQKLNLSENPLVSTAQLATMLSAADQDLHELNLNGMRLPQHVYRSGGERQSAAPVPVLGHVTHLYLIRSHLAQTILWLGSAAQLRAVYLDYSNITEQHLETVSRTWRLLQFISLVRCRLLRTTLGFALPLTDTLTHVHVSEMSLVPHHVAAELKLRGVFVQRDF